MENTDFYEAASVVTTIPKGGKGTAKLAKVYTNLVRLRYYKNGTERRRTIEIEIDDNAFTSKKTKTRAVKRTEPKLSDETMQKIKSVAHILDTINNRQEATDATTGFNVRELKALAEITGTTIKHSDSKKDLIFSIVHSTVGSRLKSAVFQSNKQNNETDKIKAFKAAYQKAGSGRPYTYIHKIRSLLDWQEEHFNSALEEFSQQGIIVLQGGNPNNLTKKERDASYYDKYGYFRMTVSLKK